MKRYPKVNGCVGSMAPIVPVVKTMTRKLRKKVMTCKHKCGITQIKEQIAPTFTTFTKQELWHQVEQPTKKLQFSDVRIEDSKKEPQKEDLRRSKHKIARIQLT